MGNDITAIERAVSTAVSKFGFTAKAVQYDMIEVRNGKGMPIGTVGTDGTIESKYVGQKVLMGSLARIAIKNALAECK